MKLTEYLKLRGVNANALTQPEAKLLGINTAVSGWVGKFAHVEIPAALAVLAAREPGKDALKAMAKSPCCPAPSKPSLIASTRRLTSSTVTKQSTAATCLPEWLKTTCCRTLPCRPTPKPEC